MHFEKGGILAIYLCNYCGYKHQSSCQCFDSDMVWVQIPSREEQTFDSSKSNSNTVWFNFQMYVIFSINLVSQATLRSSGKDILYGCQLLRCLYNILYFLWLHNEFFIIIYNILKFSVIDCCQIIILSIYVPSTHA